MKREKILGLSFATLVVPMLFGAAMADPVARINGVEITDGEMAIAEGEIGTKVASLPPELRKRAVVEYLIEAHLFADEAKKAELNKGKEFDDRVAYYQTRALRDLYFEKKLRNSVTDAQAKASYDKLVAKLPPEPEVHARHILVKTEEEAKDIIKQLKDGAKFEDLAKKSIDPGSANNGGDLGFVGKDQTVKPFEDAIFKLEPGQISEPVKSEFGWHVIRVEEKRNRPVPSFEEVKDRLTMAMLQDQLKTTFFNLRKQAKIEMIDPDLKKATELEAKEHDANKDKDAPKQ